MALGGKVHTRTHRHTQTQSNGNPSVPCFSTHSIPHYMHFVCMSKVRPFLTVLHRYAAGVLLCVVLLVEGNTLHITGVSPVAVCLQLLSVTLAQFSKEILDFFDFFKKKKLF